MARTWRVFDGLAFFVGQQRRAKLRGVARLMRGALSLGVEKILWLQMANELQKWVLDNASLLLAALAVFISTVSLWRTKSYRAEALKELSGVKKALAERNTPAALSLRRDGNRLIIENHGEQAAKEVALKIEHFKLVRGLSKDRIVHGKQIIELPAKFFMGPAPSALITWKNTDGTTAEANL